MYRFRFNLLTALIVGLAVSQSLYAQTAAPPPQAQPPARLVLEVTVFAGKPPSYQMILHAASKTPGDWYGGFRRVPGWQLPDGALPVTAVRILPRFEGEGVRVVVSVFLGQNHEQEKEVAGYHVRENEPLVVRELTQFGVEPFALKVVRTTPMQADSLTARSNAQSLIVVSVVANNSTLPSCKLTLQNFNSRDVLALGIAVLVNGQRQLSGMPQGVDGEALIAAGMTAALDTLMARATKATPAGYEPTTPPNQELVITAAVFSDGTFEGDEQTAAKFKAFMAGRKVELGRLLELLQRTLSSPELGTPAEFARFKSQAAALPTDVALPAQTEFWQSLPTLTAKERIGLKGTAEVASQAVKTELLKELHLLEGTSAQPPDVNTFQLWLSQHKERYEKWLSRLS